ncbi:MAG: hypothetical protein ACHQ9S_02815 [Candidatus Binatia bacterium]
MPTRVMRLRLYLAIVASLLAACSTRRPAALRPPRFHPPFIITFWCGPPLSEFTDARAAEIAAAGFNFVGPPCEGGPNDSAARGRLQEQALDVAARHGLRLAVEDGRFGNDAPQQPGWEAQLAQAVRAYRGHPGFGSYFVADEPSAGEIAAVAAVVARLREQDPTHLAYVNLLPDYVKLENLGTTSYTDYTERFIDTVQPQLLSYDYYPFLEDADRPSFFDNLATIRSLALRHHLPFMLIVQAMPHLHYRDPTESEIGWQIFHALAFGARGISYFAYWTPVAVASADEMNFHYGLIENGKPTRHYFEAMRLNQKAAALAAQLAPFESLGIADSAGEIGGPFPIGPIVAIEGGQITAGLFTDTTGRIAALLVNRDYRYGATVRLRLRDAAAVPERFDVAAGHWAPLTDLSITFAPGDAQLLRWGGAGAWP